MFCSPLQQAKRQAEREATGSEGDRKKHEQQLLTRLLCPPENSISKRTEESESCDRFPPLVGATFSSNWILFRKVYDLYEEVAEQRWDRENVREGEEFCAITPGIPRTFLGSWNLLALYVRRY